MGNILYTVIIVIAGGLAIQCNPVSKTNNSVEQATGHNSRNSLDWDGVYRGLLPCAGCSDLETTLYLNKDLTYKLKTYPRGGQDTATFAGSFSWNDLGNTITLERENNMNLPASYFVGENTLTIIGEDGKKMTGTLAGKYSLSKLNQAILEKYWKLTELYGKPVAVDSTYQKEPHIIFKENGNRFIGNGGCNNISGTYDLKGMGRISISQGITTQMACPRMDTETQFLKALQAADNFNLTGDVLTLNKARMAPLAKFKTVYMQ